MIKSEKLKNKVIESTHQPPHENLLLMDLPGEEWKPFPVEPFDEHYMVSNKGRAKRLAHTFRRKDGVFTSLSERIIKQVVSKKTNHYLNQNRYNLMCKVTIDKYRKAFPTARLIYYAFIEPFDLSDRNLYVRHKDNNGLNCLPDNLYLFERCKLTRWVLDNNRKIKRGGASNRSKFSKEETDRWDAVVKKPVNQYDLKGRLVRQFDSRVEAARSIGVERASISAAIKGKTQTVGGYLWREGLENHDRIEVPLLKRKFRIAQYNFEGDLIQIFPSIKSAARSVGVSTSVMADRLYKRCSPVDYIWKRIEEHEEAPLKMKTDGVPKPRTHTNKKYNIPEGKYPFQNLSIEDMQDEVWKEIPASGGTHLASNYGRIKAAERTIKNEKCCYRKRAQIISQVIKQDKKTGGLYLNVICRGMEKAFGSQTATLIYRLFHGDFSPKYAVKFIDNDPLNCKADNLKIESLSDLQRQYRKEGRISNNCNLKPIAQYTPEGKLVATYSCLKEAGGKTGFSQGRIGECANGKKAFHNGFIWKYIRTDE